MPISLELVFDMTLPRGMGGSLHHHYSATLDICAWADGLGFESLNLGEHHGTDTNYLSSPIVMAGAIAARTRKTQIRTIVLAPFYNPLRLAEDLAVLSLVSGGRAFGVLIAGYRAAEFDMYGIRLADRANAMEEVVDVIRHAWAGEPFTYRGRTIEIVSPVPAPRPRLIVGGATPLMARKAAQMDVGFSPATKPGLFDLYREELVARGKVDPGPLPKEAPGFLYVTEDPEKAWTEIGAYALAGTQMYMKWMSGTATKFNNRYPAVQTLDELKKSPAHAVVTPEQCIALLSGLGDHTRLRWQVMPHGMPPELAWPSLVLFEKKVLPHLDVSFHDNLMY